MSLQKTSDGFQSDLDALPTGRGEVSPISQGTSFWDNAWNALAIYGQYRAVDAQYDVPPAPQSDVTVVTDSKGTREAGNPRLSVSDQTRTALYLSVGLVFVGGLTYAIARG